MPTISRTDLLSVLNECRLLDQHQLNELASVLPDSSPEVEQVGKELKDRGWLTDFQIDHLMKGEGAKLALGQYILLDLLGEGGMGQVFKARHRLMNRVVALKVIRQEQLANPAAIRRFYREIRAAAQLSHPNVVIAHDADTVGHVHFFVMEYVEGIDLGQLVEDRGFLPVRQACDCIRQACLGLQHAFEKGLVHRDLKPSNLLLLRHEGQVKLLDLGLARILQDTSQSGELTRPGVVMGTPDYMAPEQGNNSHLADIRADIYSLGCTLYYLLTGQPPFPDCNLVEKLIKHRTDEPVPVQALRAEVTDDVAAVLRKLMAKKVEDRYQTPIEAAAALEPLCEPVKPASQLLDVDFLNPDPQEPYLSPTPQVGNLLPPSLHARLVPTGLSERVDNAASLAAARPPARELPSWTPVSVALPAAGAPAGSGPVPRRRSLLTGTIFLVAATVLGLGVAWLVAGGRLRPPPEPGPVAPGPDDLPVAVIPRPSATAKPEEPPVQPPPVLKHDQKLALVIGVGQFQSGELRPHPAATADAHELGKALQGQGFPPSNVNLLSPDQVADRQPRAAVILQQLRQLVQDRDETDSLVFAWSGPAVQFQGDTETYLCPADGRLQERTSLIPLREIYRTLAPCKAGFKLVLLDVCRPDPRAAGAAAGVELEAVPAPQQQAPPAGVAVLFACSAGEQGHDRKDTSRGVFFDAVCQALAKRTDLERSTRKDVADYVQQTYQKLQTPRRLGATAGDGMTLTSLVSFKQEPAATQKPPIPTPIDKPGQVGQPMVHNHAVTSVAFRPNHAEALSAARDYTMRLWDLNTHKEKTTARFDDSIEDLPWSIAISSDGKRAVTGCGGQLEQGRLIPGAENVVLLWDVDRARAQKLTGHTDSVVSVALLPTGLFAVSGSRDRTVRGWNLETGQEVFRCSGHSKPVTSVALTHDRGLIASASEDRTIRIWDGRAGDLVCTLEGHQADVNGVAFTPDGRRLASASKDRTIRIWEINAAERTGKEIAQFPCENEVLCVAFSPNGERVLSGDAGGFALLWDVQTGKEIYRCDGHTLAVTSVAFAPTDGSRALTGSADRTVRLWALPRGDRP